MMMHSSLFSLSFLPGDLAVALLYDGRTVVLSGWVGRLVAWIAALDGLVLARRPGLVLLRWPNEYAAELLRIGVEE